MQVTVNQGVFVAHATYEERKALKVAGFYWHPESCGKPGCKACAAGVGKAWWTPYKETAARLGMYADGAAKAALDSHLNEVKASKATSAEIEIPAPAGLQYFPFQKAGIAYAKSRTGTLIADEMGLGKTVQAIGLVNLVPEIKSVLVICPGSLRLNWLKEAQTWLTRTFNLYVAEAGKPVPEDADFVIVNYDRIIGGEGSEVWKSMMAREWDLLVADEAHMMKNPKALRTQAVLGVSGEWKEQNTIHGKKLVQMTEPVPGLSSRAKRNLFLTGTPILNRPLEFFPLAHALAPDLFPSRKTFVKRYVKQETFFGELQQKARAGFMVRRLKAEVLKDLPAKVRQVITLPMNGATDLINEEQAAWEKKETVLAEMKAKLALAHASEDKEAYQEALMALQEAVRTAFTELSIIRHKIALAKVPYVTAHVDSLLESGVNKVVVFAHHKDVISQISTQYGDSAVVITGETPMDIRQKAVEAFQNDASIKVFVGSLKSASMGFTLTAACNVVFAELDWTPAWLTQAEDRCHRIGQLWSVLAQHVVFDGSLDARMAHMLVEKQNIADKMLDIDPDVQAQPMVPAGPAKQVDATVAPLPKKYPATNAAEKALAKQAMQIIAGVCDGAATLDGKGFSKIDTHIGHKLANLDRSYTDGEVFLARRLAKIYRKQLPEELVLKLGFNKKGKA